MGTDKRGRKPVWQDVVSRVAAATVGGYLLTYAVTACATRLLPMPASEAVLTAAMASFLVFTGAILWAFAASTARRAWLGLLAPAAGCGAIVVALTGI